MSTLEPAKFNRTNSLIHIFCSKLLTKKYANAIKHIEEHKNIRKFTAYLLHCLLDVGQLWNNFLQNSHTRQYDGVQETNL